MSETNINLTINFEMLENKRIAAYSFVDLGKEKLSKIGLSALVPESSEELAKIMGDLASAIARRVLNTNPVGVISEESN